jgi:hypothetical protein
VRLALPGTAACREPQAQNDWLAESRTVGV